MKTSDALTRWKHALRAAAAARRDINALGVGTHRGLVMLYRADLDKWTAERDRLYATLSPEDKVTADRIAKETT